MKLTHANVLSLLEINELTIGPTPFRTIQRKFQPAKTEEIRQILDELESNGMIESTKTRNGRHGRYTTEWSLTEQ